MKPLFELINEILTESKRLKEKYYSAENLTLEYVCVLTHDSKEYDFYSEEVLKLGEIVEEGNGIIVNLYENKKVENENVKYIRIRKPDSKNSQKGFVDYSVEDYEDFKSRYAKSEVVKVVKSHNGSELLELRDNEFDVLIYIPQNPLSQELQKSKNPRIQESKDPIDELSTLKTQLNDEKERRLRLMADFENYKRRLEQEKSLFGALANIGLIQELLEVSDDITLALNDESLDLNRAKEALKLAQDKLLGSAKNAGVEKVDVKIGDEFNKETMEAVTSVPAQSEEQKGKVIAVISSAYKYANKEGIIKAAKVVVGK
jgi:molecular chaperone GrpE